MPTGIAAHECGHLVAFLAAGVRVVSVEASTVRGGYCEPDPVGRQRISPEAEAVALLAGAAAGGMYGDDGEGTVLSPGDHEQLQEACQRLGEQTRTRVTRRHVEGLEAQAWLFVREYREAITHLASKLTAAGRLDSADLAAIVHAPGSPLAVFGKLYHPPAPPSPKSAPLSSSLPPGTRWSDEHGCYVGPATPEERRQQRRAPLLADLISAVVGGGGLSCLVPGGGYPSVSAGGRLL